MSDWDAFTAKIWEHKKAVLKKSPYKTKNFQREFDFPD